MTYKEPVRLLTEDYHNLKLRKSVGSPYKVYGLSLFPSTANGVVDLCPGSSSECRRSCLSSSGYGYRDKVRYGRKNKSIFLLSNPVGFIEKLRHEVLRAIEKSKSENLIPVFRLNMYSDIAWENGYDILKTRAGVSFPLNLKPDGYDSIPHLINELGGIVYDYTKRIDRIKRNYLDLYHLTFSRTEDNDECVDVAREYGYNVAYVFRLPNGFRELPGQFHGSKVIDGDKSDLRFLDAPGSIVGLRAKGAAKNTGNGFVIQLKESDYSDKEISRNRAPKERRMYVHHEPVEINPDKSRVCPGCGIRKNLLQEYTRNNQRKYGRSYLCKVCEREYHKKVRIAKVSREMVR